MKANKRLIIERLSANDLIRIVEQAVKKEMQKANKDEVFLTLEQASKYVNIPASTLYDYTSQKKIPHYKKGKKLHFIKQELSDWMKQEPMLKHATNVAETGGAT